MASVPPVREEQITEKGKEIGIWLQGSAWDQNQGSV